MAAEYPGASWVACPGFGFPTGTHGQNHPRWIILHGTASGDGTAEQQARFFAGTSAHGVHFVIGKDGTVIQLVALADAAYGNGIIQAPHDSWWTPAVNPNLQTISIEHCKMAADNSDLLTPAQQDASFRLVKWLCDRLNIPARKADASGGITGHFSIEGVDRKNCPGPYPWDELFNFLGGSMVPTGPFISLTFGKEIPANVGWKALATQFGLTQSDLLAIPGNIWLSTYDGNPASVAGKQVSVPGYPEPAPPLPPPPPSPAAPKSYPITPEMEKRLANEGMYHAPTPEQAARYQQIRDGFTSLKRLVVTLTPPSREQSVALTHLQEGNMIANAAIALNE